MVVVALHLLHRQRRVPARARVAGAAGEAEGAENRYGPQPQPLAVEGGQREAPARYETIFKYHLLLCICVYSSNAPGRLHACLHAPVCMALFASAR